MISVDSSLFIQIANFLILIFAMNIVLYRPIRNMLAQRKEKISGLEETIDSCAQQLKESNEAYAAGIKEARNNGLKEKEKLIQAAEAQEKELIQQINEKAQAELAKIREKVAKDAEEVRKTLLQDVDKFANDIGEKILGRAI